MLRPGRQAGESRRRVRQAQRPTTPAFHAWARSSTRPAAAPGTRRAARGTDAMPGAKTVAPSASPASRPRAARRGDSTRGCSNRGPRASPGRPGPPPPEGGPPCNAARRPPHPMSPGGAHRRPGAFFWLDTITSRRSSRRPKIYFGPDLRRGNAMDTNACFILGRVAAGIDEKPELQAAYREYHRQGPGPVDSGFERVFASLLEKDLIDLVEACRKEGGSALRVVMTNQGREALSPSSTN